MQKILITKKDLSPELLNLFFDNYNRQLYKFVRKCRCCLKLYGSDYKYDIFCGKCEQVPIKQREEIMNSYKKYPEPKTFIEYELKIKPINNHGIGS